jgi:hypothetical protein
MIKKQHQMKHIIMVLGACAFIPSIANAHGITNQSVAPFFLLADFLVLVLAIPAYLWSKRLAVRLLTLFAGINIGVTITGVLACVLTMLEKPAPSSNDDLSCTIYYFATSYVWIAVPINLVLLLIWARVRSRRNRNKEFKEID